MRIQLDRILPNPHRDILSNPLSDEQVDKLIESFHRNGVWKNVVVRKSPTLGGHYELAHGHHRLKAMEEFGLTHAEFSVEVINDWGMFTAMVDENETQAHITPLIVEENISAGLRILEPMIRECETLEDFREVQGLSQRPPRDADSGGVRKQDYTKVRNEVLKGGRIGKNFLKRELPGVKSRKNDAIQAVLDMHYGELDRNTMARELEIKAQEEAAAREASLAARAEEERLAAVERVEQAERKAAQEKAEAEAKEAKADARAKAKHDQEKADAKHRADEAEAEAKRIKAEAKRNAEEAKQRAKEAKIEADRKADEAETLRKELKALQTEATKLASEGVERRVLLAFPSVLAMSEFARQVKRLKIPTDQHPELALHLINGNKVGTESGPFSARQYKPLIEDWWDRKSGAQARRSKKQKTLSDADKAFKLRNKTVDAFVLEVCKEAEALVKKVAEITPHVDRVERPAVLEKYIEVMGASYEALGASYEAAADAAGYDVVDTQ